MARKRAAEAMPHQDEPIEIAADDERDELDDLIAEIAQRNPAFPAMVEAALQKRRAARARGEDSEAAAWEKTDAEDRQEQPATPHAQA